MADAPRISWQNGPHKNEGQFFTEHNRQREALHNSLPSFLDKHPLFRDASLSVELEHVHEGQGSLVAVITAGRDKENQPGRKYVLKVRLGKVNESAEGAFLTTWGESGVHVPKVLDEGKIVGLPYLIMEYVDAPMYKALGKGKDELCDEGFYKELGDEMRKMHTRPGKGFGPVRGGRGLYRTCGALYRDSDPMSYYGSRVHYVLTHGLITHAREQYEKAVSVLTQFTQSVPSAYCHFDLGGTGNCFATTPMTIIDPNPAFEPAVLDVANTCKIIYDERGIEQFLDAYYEDGERPPKEVFAAAMFIAVVRWTPNLHGKKRHDRMNMDKDLLQRYCSYTTS